MSGEVAGGHGGWRGSQGTSGAVRVYRTFLTLDFSSGLSLKELRSQKPTGFLSSLKQHESEKDQSGEEMEGVE